MSRLKKYLLLLVAGLLSCSGCLKRISLSEPCPSSLLEEYQACKRFPISGIFSVFSSQGSFNFYLELNPEPPEGILLGISPWGKVIFKTIFQGENFLYLDLVNEMAYSNQPDWLGKDYLEIKPQESLKSIIYLLDLIQALCGKIPSGELECAKEDKLWKIKLKGLEERCRIYFFSDSGMLKKVEYFWEKEKISIWLDYEKSWFPSQIKISARGFFLQAKTIKLQQNSVAPEKFPRNIPPNFSCFLLRESW